MATKKDQVAGIIHGAAAAAAAVGAGLAQLPGTDTPFITGIQTGMIIAIGVVYDKEITKTAALTILTAAGAGFVGRTISHVLVGWIPGIGNVINASTAAALTEAIGWKAHEIISGE